jgi:hypothetical protein
MTIARRQFLQLAGAGLLAVAPRAFATEDYPTRPVRWIIGFPPGGGAEWWMQKLAGGTALTLDVFDIAGSVYVYFDKLAPLMQEQESDPRPAD